MPNPSDPKLYESVKKQIYKKYPTHSAYRSGMLVKEYKRRFAEKYPAGEAPYLGKKNTSQGLTRWFREEWRNQRGEVGYKSPGDIYRPTKRINAKTPTTFRELSPGQIERARRKKVSRGRVDRFE